MIGKDSENMILYRPVGLQELELIYDSGMKAFPPRLPQQPIFYPVLDLEYARQTASDWNAKNGQLAGYVTQFKVKDDYIGQFETHTVGSSEHQEFWIPAEEMEEFNRHLVGHIKVVAAHFGDTFQGFVPEQFGLQRKNAVEQFTLLANSFLYKRMDFYLEIKRNHKAVFLNYPFWQTYQFKNSGLKAKVLQAIKEAWLTSFPKTPLMNPVQEDIAPVKQPNSGSLVEPLDEDDTPEETMDSHVSVKPLDEHITPVRQSYAQSLVKPPEEDVPPVRPTDSTPLVDPLDQDSTPVRQSYTHSLVNPLEEEANPIRQIDAPAHFSQGLEFGLSGKYYEAIAELSKAIEDDPEDVVAHTSLGVAFHRLGEEDRARACYEAALRIDPIYAEAHYFRANILYSQGHTREAIAGYTIAVGLAPELVEAHEKPIPQDRLTDYSPTPAEMYWIAKPAHRILDLNKRLEAHPEQASLFKERAAEYYRLRNFVQASADYTSSLAIQPDDASALHFRGLAYEQLGQSERAREDYQRAIILNQQLSDMYLSRGVTFGNMGNLRQSIASFTEGIRLAPENPDAYFNRGTSYFQLGDLEKAIEDFSNAIRLSPGDESAYYWRGVSNEAAGRQGEAIADYRQFLAISQDANARAEIEGRLSQWNEGKRDDSGTARDLLGKLGRLVSRKSVVPDDQQKTIQVASEEPAQSPDVYDLVIALGERALNSIWFGSGVECYGQNAEELYAFTDQNRQIEGGDFLRIASGIRQTIQGDFQAFDPGETSPWIFLRAWNGSGFYIETNDPQIEKQLKAHFPAVEEMEGASPPYTSLFLRI